jgi:hypothetical protein
MLPFGASQVIGTGHRPNRDEQRHWRIYRTDELYGRTLHRSHGYRCDCLGGKPWLEESRHYGVLNGRQVVIMV